MNTRTERKDYIFMLRRVNAESARIAGDYLREIGVKILSREGTTAFFGQASPKQVEAAYESGMFLAISAGTISAEHLEKFEGDQLAAIELWNTLNSAEFGKLQSDRTDMGRSWADEEKDPLPPVSPIDPS